MRPESLIHHIARVGHVLKVCSAGGLELSMLKDYRCLISTIDYDAIAGFLLSQVFYFAGDFSDTDMGIVDAWFAGNDGHR